MPTREEMWNALKGEVDVLVVGGGITGCGIARDAARRGLRVALVEMRDLAFGTSSRSSKLVHGGLRYLEQYELSLVFEAVSERRILLDIAPHIVNPLGFLFPVYDDAKHPLWFINAGMWVYEGLSLFRSPKLHRTLKRKDVAKEEPALTTERLTGAPLYFDCSTDDARLTLESALDAAGSGATIATWAKVKSFLKDDSGRIQGAVVENTLTGELREIRSHVVINATGPWTDRTIAMSQPLTHGLLRPTKGVHVVVSREKLPVNNAVVCLHPGDKRVLFAIPWNDRTYIGTTDTDFEGDPADCYATREDVDYLLEAANSYFPNHQLVDDDVISTWAGLRPLIRPVSSDATDLDESAVSREHQIIVGQDGLITIAGGKLTTYRRMSAEVVDKAEMLLRLSNALPETLTGSDTSREPLPGAVGWPADDDHEKVTVQVLEAGDSSIQLETARLLANTYGMRGIDVAKLAAADPALAKPLIDGRPEIMAQVDWAVNQEIAATVTDFLKRRTQLYYRDVNQALDCVDAVAARMGELLGWTEDTRVERAEAYQREVVASRRWRAGQK
jgi:glycerol-3-phosphate dehydrogenase